MTLHKTWRNKVFKFKENLSYCYCIVHPCSSNQRMMQLNATENQRMMQSSNPLKTPETQHVVALISSILTAQLQVLSWWKFGSRLHRCRSQVVERAARLNDLVAEDQARRHHATWQNWLPTVFVGFWTMVCCSPRFNISPKDGPWFPLQRLNGTCVLSGWHQWCASGSGGLLSMAQRGVLAFRIRVVPRLRLAWVVCFLCPLVFQVSVVFLFFVFYCSFEIEKALKGELSWRVECLLKWCQVLELHNLPWRSNVSPIKKT